MFFQDVKSSITSFGAYKEFSNRKFSKTLTYLLFITSILFLLKIITAFFQFSNVLGDFQKEVIQKVPNFKLENGQFSADIKEPFIYEEQGSVIIIDPAGEYDESELNTRSEGFYITKDHMSIKNGIKLERVNFSEFKQFSLSRDSVANFLPKLKILLFIAIIPWYIAFFIRVLFTILIFSIITLIISNMKKNALPYPQLFNITAYAFTLPLILLVFVQLVEPLYPIPFSGIIRWVVAVFYIWKAFPSADNDSITLEKNE